MRRIASRVTAAIAASLILASSATATFAAQLPIANENGVPVGVVENNSRVTSHLGSDNPNTMRIGSQVIQFFRVDAPNGTCVEVTMRSRDFDSAIIVSDQAGNPIVVDDDSGGGRDARLRFNIGASGARYVIATSAKPDPEPGDYTIEFDPCGGGSAPSPAPRAPGGSPTPAR